ncbi:hypothetical protein [Niveibacterium sp.]|uniref:hypothetical protein n=1 Tax=Niveibacterium sp. TaxID=2017444 RepID=UPI0035B0D410
MRTTPLQRRRDFIPELAQAHAEELAYLWHRRRTAIRSPALTIRDFGDLNERIEAHLEGLLVCGQSLHSIVGERLTLDDRDEVFAGALPLLRSGNVDATRSVLSSFAAATGERLEGLRDALGVAPLVHTEATLRAALSHGSSGHAAAAALALAAHRRLDSADPRLARLLYDPTPSVATQAWRAALQVDAAVNPIPRPYAAAIGHDDPALRAAALEAGIWRSEPWAPNVIRKLAERGDFLGLTWMSAVGEAAATQRMLPMMQGMPGPTRCAIAARSGQPAAMQALLDWMSDADPATAASAGEAWTRLTGLDVEGERASLPVDAEADEVEREFAPEVRLPDAPKARQQWAANGSRWLAGTRWCRGHDIGVSLTSVAQRTIDLEARWDFGARAALAGAPVFPPPPAI